MDKVICYSYILIIITVLIEQMFGDYIVYILKCRKGMMIKAKVIDLDCVFRARREIDVSIYEYNNVLLALPYDSNDRVGDTKVLYINGDYVVRKKIWVNRSYMKYTCVTAAWGFASLYYISSHWEGIQDIWSIFIVCVILAIYILLYPLLYSVQLKRLKKRLGWHTE